MFELGQKVKRLEKHQSLESTVLNIIKDGDKIIYLIHYDESNERGYWEASSLNSVLPITIVPIDDFIIEDETLNELVAEPEDPLNEIVVEPESVESVEPVEPVVEPVEPVESVVEIVEPVVEPVESVEPVEPVVEPVEPVIKQVEELNRNYN